MNLKSIHLFFCGTFFLAQCINTSLAVPPPNPTASDIHGNTAGGTGVLSAITNLADSNTGFGSNVLVANTDGIFNTAIGGASMMTNTLGGSNTAVGISTLNVNKIGNNNSAFGVFALQNNTGNGNTGLGYQALIGLKTGSNNIGIGQFAGKPLTTGNNNIYIGNQGIATESNSIRIGVPSHARTFIGGISGKTVGANAVPVVIDSNGRLGTIVSSVRFKKDIQDMNDVSRKLLQLRPVTYRYKETDENGANPLEYGLIAEEVAKVYPDLIAYDAEGKIETVQYQKLTPLLLNELQRINTKLEQETEKNQALVEDIAHLKTQITRVSVLEQQVSAMQEQARKVSDLTDRLHHLEAGQVVGLNR